MADVESERESELMMKRICRFCLSQELNKLTKLYAPKSGTPLSIQVMAITTTEIHMNDCLPTWICRDCCNLFEHTYEFKNMCKRAETLLRRYPLTGKWSEPLLKPKIPRSACLKPKPKKNSLKSKPLKRGIARLPESPARSNKEGDTILKSLISELQVKREDYGSIKVVTESLDLNRPAVPESDPISTASPVESQVCKIISVNSKPLKRDLPEPFISEAQVKREDYERIEVTTEILDPNEPADPESEPILTASAVEAQVFPCSHCDRSFLLQQLLDIHIENHKRERRFQCSTCERSFLSKYDLQKHDLVHTGERPFKCTICNKCFTRSTVLHRHEKIHADIPKFVCEFCEKPFVSKDEMAKHTEGHLKKRAFLCTVCQKRFVFKQGLERHKAVHARTLQHHCQYCEQSFITNTKLSRHLAHAHAGKRKYSCKLCNRSFQLYHHLSRHLLSRSHKYKHIANQQEDMSAANLPSALQKMETEGISSLKCRTPTEVKDKENNSKTPKILIRSVLMPKPFLEYKIKCETSEHQLETTETDYMEEYDDLVDVPLKYRKIESSSARKKRSVKPRKIERHEFIS